MSQRHTYSLEDIRDMLTDRLDQVVDQYTHRTQGSYEKHGKYFTLNPGRADRSVGSFCITMSGPKAGSWNDYATGDFGDVLDLIALSLQCDLKTALREARGFLGLQTDSPEDVARRKKAAEDGKRRRQQAAQQERDNRTRRARQAQALWLSAQPSIKGTPVEHYLRDTRGIDLARLGRQPGVLRYHPECFYRHVDDQTGEVTERILPAMLAIASDVKGQPIACHRTYLAPRSDGSWGKAPVPDAKKVLGGYWGSAIHVWKGIGPRGGKPPALRLAPAGTHVLIAEGIEDALSAVMLKPEARVLAAISLGNLGQVALPDNVSDVTLIADRDENAEARETLKRAVAQHQTRGRVVRVFLNPWGGKDLNDAWRDAQGAGKGAA